ncbi:disks large-associated protein 1 isoform X1 [Oopsacas minuta]|uniref:Disks large-associated protein 1 isoform X1 n=1 Tax=Oopsacas minuta TaxID=111878 RepID=A0AAV7JRS3_9METZ|nr:disks large-associated protein 1 isoform X1 [Oopsacas minuta]
MALFSSTEGKSLFDKGTSYLASFFESDSDSTEYVSIDSPSIDEETEAYKIPAHLLLLPQTNTFRSAPPVVNLALPIDQYSPPSPNIRPPHLCQNRNGEYFLRYIQNTRSSLVTISSRGMYLLQESPPPPIDSILRTLITKAENIALITLGDFQKLCRENMSPVSDKKRPVSNDLESEWFKISRNISELSKRFDQIDNLFEESGWKQE